jgi:F-type H+/Na+-transporting ATPase subunit alpha
MSAAGNRATNQSIDNHGAAEDWLEQYRFGLRVTEQGTVLSIGDGIAHIEGLPSASMEELLHFEDGSRGLVYSLEKASVSAILLEQSATLAAGTQVYLTGQRLGIPVGDALLGRVIDPLGAPLDGGAAPDCPARRDLESLSPPIMAREFVDQPLYTGSKIADTLIPIGKGQRQLIIGDNGLGKSSFAIDAVLHQKGKNVFCVYVLVGQKRSTVVSTIETLRAAGALDYTVIVVAEATAPAGLKYLAPFAGCAVCEAWMAQGRDALVIYDDLTAHAEAYRELSLLLRRPPGREAYPGDIFYLHSRLLERSTRMAPSHGGGSMTALPIVETREGEIASYIPTNLISITDGQIYFDAALFAGGFLPAIDVTRSVSRIGGKAQHPRVAEEAGHMKLDYLRFLELEVFTRFGARLEASVEAQIKRGRILRELLKQQRLAPLPIEHQMAWLVAYNAGLLDGLAPADVPAAFERLMAGVATSELTLDDKHEDWVRAVEGWLGRVAAPASPAASHEARSTGESHE